MAIAHLSAKAVTAGKSAAAKADYVLREGKYAERHQDELVFTASGNMPAFASTDPRAFWSATDSEERKNAVRAREIEVALPKELDAAQQHQLAHDYAAAVAAAIGEEKGGALPFSLAVHNSPTNPHAHIILSERPLTERSEHMTPKDFFSRKNAKVNAWRGKSSERKQTLQDVRDAWQHYANEALRAAGQDARIDMRSYADQGIDLPPGQHLGPTTFRAFQKDKFKTQRFERLATERADEKMSTLSDEAKQVIQHDDVREARVKQFVDVIETQIEESHRERLEAAAATPIPRKVESQLYFANREHPELKELRSDAQTALDELKQITSEHKKDAQRKPLQGQNVAEWAAEHIAVLFKNLFVRPFTGKRYVTRAALAQHKIAAAKETYEAAKNAYSDRKTEVFSANGEKYEKQLKAQNQAHKAATERKQRARARLAKLDERQEARKSSIKVDLAKIDTDALQADKKAREDALRASVSQGFELKKDGTSSKFISNAERGKIAQLLKPHDLELQITGEIVHKGQFDSEIVGRYDYAQRAVLSDSEKLDKAMLSSDEMQLQRIEAGGRQGVKLAQNLKDDTRFKNDAKKALRELDLEIKTAERESGLSLG